MTDERESHGSDAFEVQYQPTPGAHWQAVTGSLGYADALTKRDEMVIAERESAMGGRYRVQPFGTGPGEVKPADDADTSQRAAWSILAGRVVRLGGHTEDIYRHANSYRWQSPDGVKLLAIGWS